MALISKAAIVESIRQHVESAGRHIVGREEAADAILEMFQAPAVQLLRDLGYTVIDPSPPATSGYMRVIAQTSRDLGIPEEQLLAGRHIMPLTAEQRAD